MKTTKLFFIFWAVSIFACNKSDEEDNNDNTDPEQEYTSFIFYHSVDATFPNCVVGYYNTEGLCIKLAEIGDLKKDIYSPEIVITIDTLSRIYLFTDYYSPRKFDAVYSLLKNKKNIFEITEGTKGIPVEKENIHQYPH